MMCTTRLIFQINLSSRVKTVLIGFLLPRPRLYAARASSDLGIVEQCPVVLRSRAQVLYGMFDIGKAHLRPVVLLTPIRPIAPSLDFAASSIKDSTMAMPDIVALAEYLFAID